MKTASGIKTVGVVTLFRNNYGSALQCYALKKCIEGYGCRCVVLEGKRVGLEAVTHSLAEKAKTGVRSIIYRGYLASKIKMRRAMIAETGLIHPESKELIDGFIYTELSPLQLRWKQLQSIGNDNSYDLFITGSDQVWNASRSIDSIFFLKFTKREKRKSYAVSLGVSSIPEWNYRSFERGVKGFDSVSVRERNSKQILRDFNCASTVECDPTLLIGPDEWRLLYSKVKSLPSNYIFVHFINDPCTTALCAIKRLSKESDLEILCFGYRHESILQFNRSYFKSGDPLEYVTLIDHARFICTDSFHTTIFSINFEKEFYVFARQYLHDSPQTCRIIDLLDRYELNDRFIEDTMQFSSHNSIMNYRDKVLEDRKHGRAYLGHLLRIDR